MTSLSLWNLSNGIDPSDAWRYQGAWRRINAFVTVAEEAVSGASQGYWWKGIDAGNLCQGFHCSQRQYLNRCILTLRHQKCSYNYEPILMQTAVANAKAKIWLSSGRPTWMSLPWGIWWIYWTAKNAWDQSNSGSAAAVVLVSLVCPFGSDTGGSNCPSSCLTDIVIQKPPCESVFQPTSAAW